MEPAGDQIGAIRERLFSSPRLGERVQFYRSFDSAESLIDWMRRRPPAMHKLHVIEGSKEAVVVIPTANAHGILSLNAARAFRGLQVILVESSGDYFNFARSMNVGIEEAIRSGPDWILFSNDDVHFADPAPRLLSELREKNGSKALILYTKNPSETHSHHVILGKMRKFGNETIVAINSARSFLSGSADVLALMGDMRRIFDKFGIEYRDFAARSATANLLRPLLFEESEKMKITASFGVVRPGLVRLMGGKLFDETYVNGGEDIDLAVRLHRQRIPHGLIDFRVDYQRGTTLGKGALRAVRDWTNLAYLNYKIRKKQI